MNLTSKQKYDLNNSNVASQNIQLGTYLDNLYESDSHLSAGVFEKPLMVQNTDGTITLGEGKYLLFSGSGFDFPLNLYTLTGGSFALSDLTTNYITVQYNSGSPIFEASTSRDNINQSNVIPVVTVYRSGSTLHLLDWDELGKGLSNKLSDRLVRTDRFVPETGGLLIGVKATRYITITGGYVWYGASRHSIQPYDSSTDCLQFYYHSSGSWISTLSEKQFRNTQYDDGTNLQTLTPNRYAVIWAFRAIEDPKHTYYILGKGDYKLLEAQNSKQPNLPSEIASQALLVGRIIIQKGSDIVEEVSSAFDTQFIRESMLHNDLSGLQGGQEDEYYHLTLAEHTKISGSSYSAEFGNADGKVTIANDGFITLSGSATFWDDLRVPLTTGKIGALNKPEFDYVNVGYLFPQNDPSEKMYIIVQLPHSWEEGTSIYPHVHYRQASTGSPVFKMEYRWTNMGDPISASALHIIDVKEHPYTGGSIHQLNTSASPINGSGKKMSSIILITLYRDDNAYTGDLLTYDFDLHYKSNSLGSKGIGSK